MKFPSVTLADWRAHVEKELSGVSFDKALVHKTAEGLAVAPLYTEAPAGAFPARDPGAPRFRIAMRHEAGGGGAGEGSADVAADLDGGADALWLGLGGPLESALARDDAGRTLFVLDVGTTPPIDAVARVARLHRPVAPSTLALNVDPIGLRARGLATFASLPVDLAALGPLARALSDRFPASTSVMASSLPYHDAGADAADEIATVLSTGAAYLEALLSAGLAPEQAARHVALQLAVGRDTFLELCKVRALRTCWLKILAAAKVTTPPRTLVHAVCSSRTLTVRDPWVNMLRVTTQVFAAVLGGADVVTPAAFDQASGPPSEMGRRVARNTGLVLRDESYLGQVTDAAGGSYYLDSLTDGLAREGWKRFQALEADGGIAKALESGRVAARLEVSWKTRLGDIAKRKLPILGVSEFANLREKLPRPVPADDAAQRAGALPVHRDAAAFEALRARADAAAPPPEALLFTLGPKAESRARVAFASGLFAAGGLKPREATAVEKAPVVCICGTDERYATEAAACAKALKAAGCGRVLLAGRPGTLEASLREAGVDGFLFVGCDALSLLSELYS